MTVNEVKQMKAHLDEMALLAEKMLEIGQQYGMSARDLNEVDALKTRIQNKIKRKARQDLANALGQ